MNDGRYFEVMPSPVGDLTLVADDEFLVTIWLGDAPRDSLAGAVESGRGLDAGPNGGRGRHKVLADARAELDAYFAGDLRTFTVPTRAQGTPFQQRVWRALDGIPFGETTSYGEIAARIGAPGSARAVGAANGRNPLPIIVPCHRVIGANGRLVGYGGGLPRKTWLLTHEAGVR